MQNKLRKEVKDLKFSKIREFNKFAVSNGAEYYLTIGEPNFSTYNNIKDAAIEAVSGNYTHYSNDRGMPELISGIAEFEKQQHGIIYSNDEILVTVGSTEALKIALESVIESRYDSKDEVIVFTPCYPLYGQLISLFGGTPVYVDTAESDFQIERETLQEALTENTKAVILNSPNNPTGCLLSDESMKNVRDAAQERDLFVICDDAYTDLIYEDTNTEGYSSFAKYSEIRDRIIVCKSFSKPYAMTGWRVGYLMTDRKLMEHIYKLHQYTVLAVNTFVQLAAAEALKTDTSPYINEFRKRRDYVCMRLERIGMDTVKPEGAFYVFPSIKKYNISSSEFCRRFVLEKKVALTPGECFDAEGYVRISYCVDMDILKTALDKLEEFILSL